MYFWRFWLALAMLYFAIHLTVGYLRCADRMCPGDREDNWVLEFRDEDTGEPMIKINGKVITKKQWLQEQVGETTK